MISRVLPYVLSALAGICFVQGVVLMTNEGDDNNASFGNDSGNVRPFSEFQ
jgi:hypothetical protein